MATEYIPPVFIEDEKPTIFLAGPIQGARDWQSEAVTLFESKNYSGNIANPRRPLKTFGDFTIEQYNEQVDWETAHLSHAGNTGVVLFYLAKQDHEIRGRAYAQTTRFELGEWKTLQQVYCINMVIGIEEGFSNAKYIRRRLSQDNPNVPVLSSLEDTVQAALNCISF